MITIDNKEYDETKLSDKGKIAFSQLQQIAQKQTSLTLDFQNTQILSKTMKLLYPLKKWAKQLFKN